MCNEKRTDAGYPWREPRTYLPLYVYNDSPFEVALCRCFTASGVLIRAAAHFTYGPSNGTKATN